MGKWLHRGLERGRRTVRIRVPGKQPVSRLHAGRRPLQLDHAVSTEDKAMTRLLTLLLLSVAAALPASAQEGHPLVGTWQGEWGNSQFLTLILEWDGKNITGVANPGPDTMVD